MTLVKCDEGILAAVLCDLLTTGMLLSLVSGRQLLMCDFAIVPSECGRANASASSVIDRSRE